MKIELITTYFHYIKNIDFFYLFKIVLEEIREPLLQLHEVLRLIVSACNSLKYRAQSLTNSLQLGG